jgi:8-oxo-dGDP phosphatase
MEWKVHGHQRIYASEWVNLEIADVELPDGQRLAHHVLRLPRTSVVVAMVDDAERVLMLWRHRFITDRWGWELPLDGGLPSRVGSARLGARAHRAA